MIEKASLDYGALKIRAKELAKGPEDRPVIEARLKKLSQHGIPIKNLILMKLSARKNKYWTGFR